MGKSVNNLSQNAIDGKSFFLQNQNSQENHLQIRTSLLSFYPFTFRHSNLEQTCQVSLFVSTILYCETVLLWFTYSNFPFL
jgi:hypothetical protein